MERDEKGHLVEGLFWMYTISMFVFWVPVFGGLAAGFVGGHAVGRVRGALEISIIPGIIFSLIMAILIMAFQVRWLPIIGVSFSLPVMIFSYVLFLMVGAVLGGIHRQFAVV